MDWRDSLPFTFITHTNAFKAYFNSHLRHIISRLRTKTYLEQKTLTIFARTPLSSLDVDRWGNNFVLKGTVPNWTVHFTVPVLASSVIVTYCIELLRKPSNNDFDIFWFVMTLTFFNKLKINWAKSVQDALLSVRLSEMFYSLWIKIFDKSVS